MARFVIPQFLRFCIVGGIAFVVDYALLEGLTAFELPFAIARLGSLAIALHVSYFLHGVFTYRDHRGYTRATWLQFMGSNILGALINYGLSVLVVSLAPFTDAQLTHLSGMIVGTVLSMGFNYWANQRFAFARQDPL